MTVQVPGSAGVRGRDNGSQMVLDTSANASLVIDDVLLPGEVAVAVQVPPFSISDPTNAETVSTSGPAITEVIVGRTPSGARDAVGSAVAAVLGASLGVAEDIPDGADIPGDGLVEEACALEGEPVEVGESAFEHAAARSIITMLTHVGTLRTMISPSPCVREVERFGRFTPVACVFPMQRRPAYVGWPGCAPGSLRATHPVRR